MKLYRVEVIATVEEREVYYYNAENEDEVRDAFPEAADNGEAGDMETTFIGVVKREVYDVMESALEPSTNERGPA